MSTACVQPQNTWILPILLCPYIYTWQLCDMLQISEVITYEISLGHGLYTDIQYHKEQEFVWVYASSYYKCNVDMIPYYRTTWDRWFGCCEESIVWRSCQVVPHWGWARVASRHTECHQNSVHRPDWLRDRDVYKMVAGYPPLPNLGWSDQSCWEPFHGRELPGPEATKNLLPRTGGWHFFWAAPRHSYTRYT